MDKQQQIITILEETQLGIHSRRNKYGSIRDMIYRLQHISKTNQMKHK